MEIEIHPVRCISDSRDVEFSRAIRPGRKASSAPISEIAARDEFSQITRRRIPDPSIPPRGGSGRQGRLVK